MRSRPSAGSRSSARRCARSRTSPGNDKATRKRRRSTASGWSTGRATVGGNGTSLRPRDRARTAPASATAATAARAAVRRYEPLERVRVLTKCRLIPDQSRPASGGPDQVDARRSRRTLAIASPQVGELGVESDDESSAFGFDAVGVTTLLILTRSAATRATSASDRSGNPPRPVPATREADHEIDARHGRDQQHEQRRRQRSVCRQALPVLLEGEARRRTPGRQLPMSREA